jgi:DNA-binding transcriptional LysR family regulator
MTGEYKKQQVFIQAVENNSITKAADILGMSKSSVSRILAQVEAEWSSQLLIRSTRNISVTDAGNAVYIHFVNLVEDAKKTKRIIESSANTISGEIRIASAESFANQFLARIINNFTSLYPEVKFEVVISSDHENLIDKMFDLAFRIGELEDSGLKHRCLFKDELCLFANKSYIDSHHHEQTLSNHNCLIYTGMPLPKQWLKALGKSEYSKVAGNISSNSESFLINMARLGQGVLLFPKSLLKSHIEKGELEQVMETQSSSININVLYPYTRRLPRSLRVFLDFVVEKFNSQISTRL